MKYSTTTTQVPSGQSVACGLMSGTRYAWWREKYASTLWGDTTGNDIAVLHGDTACDAQLGQASLVPSRVLLWLLQEHCYQSTCEGTAESAFQNANSVQHGNASAAEHRGLCQDCLDCLTWMAYDESQLLGVRVTGALSTLVRAQDVQFQLRYTHATAHHTIQLLPDSVLRLDNVFNTAADSLLPNQTAWLLFLLPQSTPTMLNTDTQSLALHIHIAQGVTA